ncbi:MAG: hypothetical protein M5R37_02395 [Melioribacteraceae bacterium]|jgi:ligand-binding sensor domain-containing protein|nr:hypothetical protein [Melioribacteraceae bacterium]
MPKFLIIVLLVFANTLIAQKDIEKYLNGIDVLDIAGDGSNIWFATNSSGLYKYSLLQDEWENYNSSNGLQNDFIYSVTANSRYVWAGSIDGLFVFDQRTKRWLKRKFSKGGQLSNWIRSIEYDVLQDVVWIGRFLYLTKFDINSRRFTDFDLTINKDEKSNTIKTIALDGDSLVWFGTENGLHKYNKYMDLSEPGALSYYDNRLNYFNGEGENISVADILFERNFVWIGLDQFITPDNPNYNIGGLYRYDRRNEWLRIDSYSGLDGDGIYALERTGNYIWASIYEFSITAKEAFGRGLALINRITGEVKMLNDERIPNSIHSLYFDGKSMWLGSSDGVVRINLFNEIAQWGDHK